MLQRARAINTLSADDIANIRNINGLLQEDKGETLNHAKDSYNIATKGMLASYQDAKKGTAFTLQWIEVVCDFFEKLRNLFQWEDPNMTFLFLLLLVVLFLFVTFLPLRFILSCAVFYKFYKGRHWQKKRTTNNQEVCKIEMQNFFCENKIPMFSYEDPWDKICQKIPISDFNKTVKMEKRLQQYFQSTVKIYLPKDVLTQQCPTPNDLISFVGLTPFVIMLPKNDRNEWIRINNPKIRKKATPLHYHLHNFIMWRIPSDFYKIKSPSLGLVGDQVKLKKSKRQTIKVEGASFRFIKEKDHFTTSEPAKEVVELLD